MKNQFRSFLDSGDAAVTVRKLFKKISLWCTIYQYCDKHRNVSFTIAVIIFFSFTLSRSIIKVARFRLTYLPAPGSQGRCG